LVFGFSEFEKAKFDFRFQLIKTILPQIKLEKLEDFELIEKIIYKINELLRLKSSNLNKTIRDPSKNLRKKDVLLILEELKKIKWNYLNENNCDMKIEIGEIRDKEIEIGDDRIVSAEKREDKRNIEKENLKSDILEEKKIETDSVNTVMGVRQEQNLGINNILLNNDKLKIELVNNSAIYLKILFKEDLDFIILNKLSTIFFQLINSDGTNIIKIMY